MDSIAEYESKGEKGRDHPAFLSMAAAFLNALPLQSDKLGSTDRLYHSLAVYLQSTFLMASGCVPDASGRSRSAPFL